MFFRNSRVRFFQISWLDYEQYGKNHYKKKQQNQHSSVINFKLFKCQPSIDNSIDFYLLFYSEKVHDSTEFSCENSKPLCESRITTH